MNAQVSCPTPADLKSLLDATLAEPRQTEVSRHLESCADCQRRLESLAAGGDSWSGVAAQLRGEDAPGGPALDQAVEELASVGGAGLTTDTRPADEDVPLDFLDPPAEAGHLGRLEQFGVLEVIGRGGMGIVLKAFDESLRRIVALKVMSPRLATSATARQRFVREVQAAAAVRDEHVVGIYAVGEAKGLPYLAMEYDWTGRDRWS